MVYYQLDNAMGIKIDHLSRKLRDKVKYDNKDRKVEMEN